MKSVIFIHSVMLLFFSSPTQAQSFSEVNKCLTGIHKVDMSTEGNYSSVLLSGNKLGGSLLVATDKGAEVIQGAFNENEQTINFIFTPPGQKTKLLRQYHVQANNELEERWTQESVELSLSPSRKVIGKEALTLSGQKSFEMAQDRAMDIDGQMDRLEKSVKGLAGTIKQKSLANLQEITVAIYKPILQQKEKVNSKYLESLKSCDGLPDKNIQKAAVIERERLEKLQRKLIEMGIAPEAPKNKPADSNVK